MRWKWLFKDYIWVWSLKEKGALLNLFVSIKLNRGCSGLLKWITASRCCTVCASGTYRRCMVAALHQPMAWMSIGLPSTWCGYNRREGGRETNTHKKGASFSSKKKKIPGKEREQKVKKPLTNQGPKRLNNCVNCIISLQGNVKLFCGLLFCKLINILL